MTATPTQDADIVAESFMDMRHLPRDLAIVKIENDSMMALAAARPRDYPAVLADVRSQIETFPSFARQAMYSKPVGKDYKTGKMKYARGLSIRAAEAIRCSMGHNKIRCSVTPVDLDTVKVEATFSDFASGSIWQDETMVSRLYQTRAYPNNPSKTVRHAEDRFNDVVIKAAKSKCVREVILRSMPPGLRSELELLVDEQLDSFLDDSTVQKLVASFAGKGVTEEMIANHIGKKMGDFNKADRATLLGVWNALEQEETTVAQAFGEDDAPQTSAPPQAKPATGKTDALADELSGPPEEEAPAPVPDKKQSAPAQPEVSGKPTTQDQLRIGIRAKWMNLVADSQHGDAAKWLEDYGLQSIDDVKNVLGIKPLTAMLESLA